MFAWKAVAPPPLIPAHSASKTRVNALMLEIQSCLHAIGNLGPRFRGDKRPLHAHPTRGAL